MAGVVQIPVTMQQALLLRHTLIQCSCGVRCKYVKCSSLNPLADRPFDSAVKYSFIILIHTKNEATIYHHSKIMKPPNGSAIVSIEVLVFMLLLQIGRVERFEPHK